VLRDEVDVVVGKLQERGVFAHVHHSSSMRVGCASCCSGGAEAIWDTDGPQAWRPW
jgi:hypothetical protein